MLVEVWSDASCDAVEVVDVDCFDVSTRLDLVRQRSPVHEVMVASLVRSSASHAKDRLALVHQCSRVWTVIFCTPLHVIRLRLTRS